MSPLQAPTSQPDATRADPVLHVKPLGFPWETADPFLFCAYHDDAYPEGDGQMAPHASLDGRDIGQDFSRRDGWSLYHGETVPGFPGHPHRGFETVTIVRKGLIDHADSLGAAARFGAGDVQWVTAGGGIVHSEMFPLLDNAAPNPLELFQIWLNLPAASKMVQPHFTMLWSEQIPREVFTDAKGLPTEVVVVAGRVAGGEGAIGASEKALLPTQAEREQSGTRTTEPLAPPPDSWAARPDADVAIWTIRMAPGARWVLPRANGRGTTSTLYFFKGEAVQIASRQLAGPAAVSLRADAPTLLENTGTDAAEFLLLQGRPIGEPVVQYGPFVMNTQEQIRQAMRDYQQTQFGGWPWPDGAPVHGRDPARFARHPDGREERPAG
jgi:quercetin 2,3-dioxygenase